MKTLTVDDYKKAGEVLANAKYWYVAKELGEGAKPEDILKVMETVGLNRIEEKTRRQTCSFRI